MHARSTCNIPALMFDCFSIDVHTRNIPFSMISVASFHKNKNVFTCNRPLRMLSPPGKGQGFVSCVHEKNQPSLIALTRYSKLEESSSMSAVEMG